MSEYEEVEEKFDEQLDADDCDQDILAIQEEYRRKRLIESLLGPVISTIFHVILIHPSFLAMISHLDLLFKLHISCQI